MKKFCYLFDIMQLVVVHRVGQDPHFIPAAALNYGQSKYFIQSYKCRLTWRSTLDITTCAIIICWLSPPQGIGLPLKFEKETREAWYSEVRVWCRLNIWDGDVHWHYYFVLRVLKDSPCLVCMYMLRCSRCELRRTCEQCNKSKKKKKAIATRGSDEKKRMYTNIINKQWQRLK